MDVERTKAQLAVDLAREQQAFARRCELEHKRAALKAAFEAVEAGQGDVVEHLLTIRGAMDALNPVERAPVEAMLARLADRIGPDPEAAKSTPATKRRQAVTLEEAAEILGKSVPTVRNWEAGRHTPEGWPGRGDAMALKAWANRHEEGCKLKRALRGTIHTGNVDKLSRWAKDDA